MISKLFNKYSYLFLLSISLVLFSFQAFLKFTLLLNEWSWLITCTINVLLIIYFYKKSVPIIIMLAFFLPYFYIPKFYFLDGLYISHHLYYQETHLINKVALLNSMFLISLLIGLGSFNYNKIPVNLISALRSKYLFYFILSICAFILIFGIQGETILESGYASEDVQKGTLHEYFIVFFLLLILASEKSNFFEQKLIFLLLISYIFKSLIYGGRIEVLIVSLMYLYIYHNYMQDQKLKIFIFAIFAYIFFDFMGRIRSNPDLIIAVINLDFSNLFSIFSADREIISNQFGDVYQSSLRVVGLYDDRLIDWWTGLKSFFLIVFGLAPSSIMPGYYNLSTYLQNIASSGGGGFIVAFSYIWLWYFGPILFGLFIGCVIRISYQTINPIISVYSLMILVFFPRWFAYYPITLFKVSVFALIASLIMYFIKKLLLNTNNLHPDEKKLIYRRSN